MEKVASTSGNAEGQEDKKNEQSECSPTVANAGKNESKTPGTDETNSSSTVGDVTNSTLEMQPREPEDNKKSSAVEGQTWEPQTNKESSVVEGQPRVLVDNKESGIAQVPSQEVRDVKDIKETSTSSISEDKDKKNEQSETAENTLKNANILKETEESKNSQESTESKKQESPKTRSSSENKESKESEELKQLKELVGDKQRKAKRKKKSSQSESPNAPKMRAKLKQKLKRTPKGKKKKGSKRIEEVQEPSSDEDNGSEEEKELPKKKLKPKSKHTSKKKKKKEIRRIEEEEPSSDDEEDSEEERKTAKEKRRHAREVRNLLDEFVEAVTSRGPKSFMEEFKGAEKYPAGKTMTISQKNEARNRYDNVFCLDDTRVVLTLCVPPETDYIHASWVKCDNVDHTFIAAQGPLEKTAGDFWRLIYQESVATIVMLCSTVEKGEEKCFQYWPLKLNAKETFGVMRLSTIKIESESHFTTYTIRVILQGFISAVTVKLIHMAEWPDRSVPKKFAHVLLLLKRLELSGTCLVHCSAGIGRTGTAITIQVIKNRLFKGIRVSILDILKEVRSKRAMSIQTSAQYLFVICVILEYVKAKVPKRYDEKVFKFQEEARQLTTPKNRKQHSPA